MTTKTILPDGSMPNGISVGTGAASGVTTFQWSDNVSWWSPCNSYFFMRLRFTKAGGNIPILNANGQLDPAELVTYADNFPSTFFSNIQTYIENDPVDDLTQPWVVDQVLTYSGAKKDFLDTFGSLARVGEPLQKRLLNVYGNGNSSGGVIEVCYRPPCSIYSTHLLPPGAKHRIDFTWNQSIVNAFESLIGSIDIGDNAGQYNIKIDNFYFYKATCRPAPLLQLQPNGVIDLACAGINQYTIPNSSQWQQNITMKSTTNRVYIVFQDNNQTPRVTNINTATTSPYLSDETAIRYMGYGTGWTPITSFSKSFSTTSNLNPDVPVYLAELSQLYLQISDLSLQLPKPTYNFSQNGNDYVRAYMDWASQTVGTKYNDTGSVPFGYGIRGSTTTLNTTATLNNQGCTIIAPNFQVNGVTTATYKVGNPSNNQQLNLITSANTNFEVIGTNPSYYAFQTSEYGWLARHPGPIFCFNVCRPAGKKISKGDVNVSFTNSVNSVIMSVIYCYSRALAVSKLPDGNYSYQLVEGV